jgi:hypothetical protein
MMLRLSRGLSQHGIQEFAKELKNLFEIIFQIRVGLFDRVTFAETPLNECGSFPPFPNAAI